MEDRAVPKDNGIKKEPGVSLGNIKIAGDDVLLQYEFTKLVLAFANRNELMSHKLIGIMEATKHGLCSYTDMLCISDEPTEADE